MDEHKIGQRIKKFRENKEITLEQMADRTGLDLNFLRAVEEENMYPSLGPLLKISRALGVRLGTFLDDQVSHDPLVVRVAERKEELTMHTECSDPAMTFHSLGRGKSDRHMEPFYIDIAPGCAKDVKLSSHEGEEFIVCVKGRVCVVYGQSKTVLEPGDSIYYNSVVPHEVSNASEEPAAIYAVLYFPE
ncbi:MAG: helix-turn-helix domain-containing protein [Desulfovibrionaceae bacterium]